MLILVFELPHFGGNVYLGRLVVHNLRGLYAEADFFHFRGRENLSIMRTRKL